MTINKVGAVGEGASGALYFGCNMEFHGTSINTSVHGEQALTLNAYTHHHDHPLKRIAVNASPCGHCRQFLHEYAPNVLVCCHGVGLFVLLLFYLFYINLFIMIVFIIVEMEDNFCYSY